MVNIQYFYQNEVYNFNINLGKIFNLDKIKLLFCQYMEEEEFDQLKFIINDQIFNKDKNYSSNDIYNFRIYIPNRIFNIHQKIIYMKSKENDIYIKKLYKIYSEKSELFEKLYQFIDKPKDFDIEFEEKKENVDHETNIIKQLGFTDEEKIKQVLKKYSGHINLATRELLNS
jgi:hypothetical protein